MAKSKGIGPSLAPNSPGQAESVQAGRFNVLVGHRVLPGHGPYSLVPCLSILCTTTPDNATTVLHLSGSLTHGDTCRT